jgi:hypothetical protein
MTHHLSDMKRSASSAISDPPAKHPMTELTALWASAPAIGEFERRSQSPTSSRTLSLEGQIYQPQSAYPISVRDAGVNANLPCEHATLNDSMDVVHDKDILNRYTFDITQNGCKFDLDNEAEAKDLSDPEINPHVQPTQIPNRDTEENESKRNHGLYPYRVVPLHHLYHVSSAHSSAFSPSEREELAHAAANPEPKKSPLSYGGSEEKTVEGMLEMYMREMESATRCGFDLENEDEEYEVTDGRYEERGGEKCNEAHCTCKTCNARYGPVVQAICCTGSGYVWTEKDRKEMEAAAGMELPDEDGEKP